MTRTFPLLLIVLLALAGCRSGRSPSRSGRDASPPAADASRPVAPAPVADAAVTVTQTEMGPACQALLGQVLQSAVPLWADLGFKTAVAELTRIYEAETAEVLRACQLLRPEQLACLRARPDPLGASATCRLDRTLRVSTPEVLEARLAAALRPACPPLAPAARETRLRGLEGRWARPATEVHPGELLVLDAKGTGQSTEQPPGAPAGTARTVRLEPLTTCTARRTLGEGAEARSTEMLLVPAGPGELLLAPLALPLGAPQPAPGKLALLAVDPTTVVVLAPDGCSVVRLDVLARYPAQCQRQEAWLQVGWVADGQTRTHRFEVVGDFLALSAYREAHRLARQR